MPPRSLFDLSNVDPDRVVADIEKIRAHNPQRHEFEQLSHICHLELEPGEIVGVLDVPEDPWWAKGHVPQRPLMPGVLMLESAAQLCSWYVHQVYDASKYGDKIFGFGGIDGVKFRSIVFPPDRLLIVGKRSEIRPRRAVFDTQGYHAESMRMVFEARIAGLWV